MNHFGVSFRPDVWVDIYVQADSEEEAYEKASQFLRNVRIEILPPEHPDYQPVDGISVAKIDDDFGTDRGDAQMVSIWDLND